jgi:hypothetical protein
VAGPPPPAPAGPASELGRGTLPAIVAAMGDEGDRVAPRLERGCRCFGVLSGGEVLAYGWLSTRSEWIGELAVAITPAEGEGYIWNCLTLPAHRRRGFYRSVLSGIVASARAEGLERLWIGSVQDPAERADAEAGFVPLLDFAATRFAGLRWLRASPAPGADPAMVEAARSRLGLRSWVVFGSAPVRKH